MQITENNIGNDAIWQTIWTLDAFFPLALTVSEMLTDNMNRKRIFFAGSHRFSDINVSNLKMCVGVTHNNVRNDAIRKQYQNLQTSYHACLPFLVLRHSLLIFVRWKSRLRSRRTSLAMTSFDGNVYEGHNPRVSSCHFQDIISNVWPLIIRWRSPSAAFAVTPFGG